MQERGHGERKLMPLSYLANEFDHPKPWANGKMDKLGASHNSLLNVPEVHSPFDDGHTDHMCHRNRNWMARH